MSTIRVNAIQHTTANSGNMILHANGNVSMITSNTTLFIGNTAISNAGISVGGTAINPLATGMRNRIINGDMRIDQRNAGATSNLNNTTETFTIDRFVSYKDAGTITSGQSSTAPSGFPYSLLWSVTTGASATSGQYFFIKQHIEGFNTADFNLGTSAASTFTLSFWVRSSITGTHSGSFTNSAVNRSYPWTYTINQSNTWEYKTITITGDTTGTWIGATNGIGLRIYWDLGSGSGARSSAGSWQTGTYTGVTGAVSVSATSGATFYITGAQLEIGSVATPFEFRHFGTELALCQRYFYKLSGDVNRAYPGSGWVDVSTSCITIITFPVQMRSAPTFTNSGVASDYAIRWGGSNITTCTGVPTSTDTCTLTARIDSPASGMTAGYGGAVRNATANGHFSFSSEL